MTERLKGKVAVITGASSGIGEATARSFVQQGAYVLLGDIQEDLMLSTFSVTLHKKNR